MHCTRVTPRVFTIINFLIWRWRETYHVTLLEFKFTVEERGAYFFTADHVDRKLCLIPAMSYSPKANIQVGIRVRPLLPK